MWTVFGFCSFFSNPVRKAFGWSFFKCFIMVTERKAEALFMYVQIYRNANFQIRVNWIQLAFRLAISENCRLWGIPMMGINDKGLLSCCWVLKRALQWWQAPKLMSSLALKLLSSLALLLGQKYAISVGAVVKVVKNKNEIGPHSSNPFGKSRVQWHQ